MQCTVKEAAKRLGISEDAIRKRLRRGALKAEKRRGRLYVDLDPDTSKTVQDKSGQESKNESNDLSGLVKAKDEEIARLIGLLERTSDEKDRLLKVVEREQILRQQQQGQIDHMQAQIEPSRAGWWQRLIGKSS